MADELNSFPSPQPGDSEDVELALETAQRLYQTGDHVEALKWLRRAVNAADEAGDDLRQLELARAAADYAAFASVSASIAAEAPPVEVADRESPVLSTSEPPALLQQSKPPPSTPYSAVLTGSAPSMSTSPSLKPKPLSVIAEPTVSAPSLKPEGSLRVAVRVSARDENLYVARPLPLGQRAPAGTREAWLCFDEAFTKNPPAE